MPPEYLTEWVLEAVRRGDINDAQRALKQKELSEQLFEAVDDNDIAAVKKALDEWADVNAIGEEDGTPLHWAARFGYTEIAKLLIEAGALVNAGDEYDRRPLYWAKNAKEKETAALLKQHGGVA